MIHRTIVGSSFGWLAAVVLAAAQGCGSSQAGPAPGLVLVQGDAQTATPGAALATAPTVRVVDSKGNGVSAVSVTFTVTAGGGTIQSASAKTGGDGQATCGTWTLGVAPGLQTVSASISGGASVVFVAIATQSSPDVTITIGQPKSSATVGREVDVVVYIDSTFEIASVTAATAAGSSPLASLGATPLYGPTWSGKTSAAGLPSGQLPILVTAIDVQGNRSDVGVVVSLDPLPVLTVTSPEPNSIARPSVNVAATCADDAPASCASFALMVESTTLLSGTGSLSGTVDLTPWEGRAVNLLFVGRDGAGQETTIGRQVYVESSAKLDIFATLPSATTVKDISGTRILYLDSTGATPVLRILDTDGNATQDVATGGDLADQSALFTPTGVAYTRSTSATSCEGYLWKGQAPADLGAMDCWLQVAGNYMIFDQGSALVRRDLGTDTNVTIVGNNQNQSYDVVTSGDVAYSAEDGNIYRWSGGDTQQLTTDGTTHRNYRPKIVGQGVVYHKDPYAVVLVDGEKEDVLAATASVYATDRAYVTAGGYVAYLWQSQVPQGGQLLQVWRHSSSGEEQLTTFSKSSTLETIGDDGTVLLTEDDRRYRAVPGKALEDIGSAQGLAAYRTGSFYVILGRTVLRVLP